MARTPAVRSGSFSADSAYLIRLVQRIEKDPKRPEEWKQKVIAKLHDLSIDLINAP